MKVVKRENSLKRKVVKNGNSWKKENNAFCSNNLPRESWTNMTIKTWIQLFSILSHVQTNEQT